MTSVWTTLFTRPSRYNWMLQYYLRAHGIAMGWVGSGRFIFSHDFTDPDCAEFRERFVAASLAMEKDGWWWTDARLTDAWIRRRVLKETLAALFLGRRRRKVPPMEPVPMGVDVREPALKA
jgi:glutamate-1-semialdehyde 2,1-aminomutase